MSINTVTSSKVPGPFMPVFEFGTQGMLWSVSVLIFVEIIFFLFGVRRNSPLGATVLQPLVINTLAWAIFASLVAPAWYHIRKYHMEARFKPYFMVPDDTEDALSTSIPSTRRLGWQMLSQ